MNSQAGAGLLCLCLEHCSFTLTQNSLSLGVEVINASEQHVHAFQYVPSCQRSVFAYEIFVALARPTYRLSRPGPLHTLSAGAKHKIRSVT